MSICLPKPPSFLQNPSYHPGFSADYVIHRPDIDYCRIVKLNHTVKDSGVLTFQPISMINALACNISCNSFTPHHPYYSLHPPTQ